MLEFTQGDMFDVPADIRVNTVNCVGVMGAGVALAFKQRYPEMFKAYQQDCADGLVRPGRMHVWKSLSGDWVINFPTKRDWRDPSRYEDIEAGLDDLRQYLDGLGAVTVALPALGCGHGGLDWTRVSAMIREKLDGMAARVLVFEPAASRRAGKSVLDGPTDEERKEAESLGYRLDAVSGSSEGAHESQAFRLGALAASSNKWIALVPSRAPGERELQALGAIAAELARSNVGATVALVYGAKSSEEVAHIFTRHGLDTVILLPFGVLTRKAVAKLVALDRHLALVSAVPANAKWTPQLFAQTMDSLQTHAAALLLSDPEPHWLAKKGLAKWAHTPIAYVRYESTPDVVRDALHDVGARPIGRRPEGGSPNIERLLAAWLGEFAASYANSPPSQSTALETKIPASSDDRAMLAMKLGEDSGSMIQELLEALRHLDGATLNLTVELPTGSREIDLQKLKNLGFRLQKQA
jgi:O-acetyl-ADP-ribose deacetylase (regulator of RNase III)